MIRRLSLLTAFAFTACAGTKQDSSFDYLTKVPTCGVILRGGVPPESSDPRLQADRFWYSASAAITEFVAAEMEPAYEVKLIDVPYELAERTAQYGVSALAKFRCSRLLQVVHDVQTDGDGPHFTFKLIIARAERTKSDSAKLVIEYERAYRFERTGETMGSFVPSDFAHVALGDAQRTDALSMLKK